MARITRVMGDHADGRTGTVQLAEQFHDGFTVGRVQVSGRLVGQQDGRIAGYRAGHGHTLLLTAGQLRGIVLHAMRHSHALERLLHPLHALGRAHAAIGEREFHVLVDREVADEVKGLENEADLSVANAGPVGRREIRDVLAAQHVRATGRCIEQAKDREQRGLAASRRAIDRHVLTGPDVEMNVGQRMGFHFVREENLLDPRHADKGLSGRKVVRHGHRSILTRLTLSNRDMSEMITLSRV